MKVSVIKKALFIAGCFAPACGALAADVITLNGKSLSIEQLLQLQAGEVQVDISDQGRRNIIVSYELLLDSAKTRYTCVWPNCWCG